MCVAVRKVANGFLYVTEGYTLNKSEGCTGVWTPVTLPAKPTLRGTRPS